MSERPPPPPPPPGLDPLLWATIWMIWQLLFLELWEKLRTVMEHRLIDLDRLHQLTHQFTNRLFSPFSPLNRTAEF